MLKHGIAVLFLFGTIAACSSSGDGDGGISGFKSCTSDSGCPSGQGCDTEGGSMTDGYCSPLCSDDTTCPMGYACPGAQKNQPGECDEVDDHTGGQGVCDQFDGVAGPTTC